MAVQVDETRHDKKIAAVDHLVGLTVITVTHEVDGVAGEDHVGMAQVLVRVGALVPSSDPGGVLDPGCPCHVRYASLLLFSEVRRQTSVRQQGASTMQNHNGRHPPVKG